MSSIKFYNDDTEFEDDIFIDEDENVEFVNMTSKKTDDKKTDDKKTDDKKTDDKKTDEIEMNIIDEIKSDEIEYIDDTSDELRDFIKTVKITHVVHSDYIDYTDDQFKNNILLLTKDDTDNENTITNVNNLLSVYTNLKKENTDKMSDKLFYPIVSIKKKIFLIDNDKNQDTSLYNDNDFLVKDNIENYLIKNKNINNSNESYDIKQNRIYELERPFEVLKDSETKGFKYKPEFNRDVITDCITENIDNYNQLDFKCVDINNNPRKLDKFRLLSKKDYKINDEDIRQLYSGDEVRIIGYINKIPKEGEAINFFDIEQYYEDINDMKVNDKIFIKLTINNNNDNHVGKIVSIQDNLIKLKLDKKILFINNQNTNTLTYDKNNNNNYFTLYNENEKKNVFDKISLFDKVQSITVFKFPEIFNENEYQKYLSFILPSLKELILNDNNFINYKELDNLLNKYKFDINNLDKQDINIINIKLNENIKKFIEKNTEKLKLNKIENKKYNFKTSVSFLENFPKHYNEYLDTEIFKDDNINRSVYLSNLQDKGNFHFINEMKKTLEKELELIKDIDFDKELNLFQTEYKKLELEKNKYNPDDCKQIKIDKFYYSAEILEKDEGKKNNYEGKYVVLNDGNIFLTIYKMNNGNWVKQFNLHQNERENIKICDGSYYYKKLDKNICMYDDVTSLCKKRDEFINNRNLNKLLIQINIIKELKDFNNNFKKYNKYLDKVLNNYKKTSHNFYYVKQIAYEKSVSDKKFLGDENFIDFNTIYNNFEVSNDPFYIPLNDTSSNNKIENKKNEYEKLINKILQSIGFEISDSEIVHVVKAIDNINQKILQKKISDSKTENKEYKNLSDKEIINKLYNNVAEQRNDIHKNIILIIASMIIIIIQIQYPNVKLTQLNQKCSKFFSLLGYPIEKSSKEDIKKQLYVYVGCCLYIDFKDELNNLSNNLILNKIQQTIRIILKERPYYITLLKKNTKIYQEVKERKFKIKVWSGYKPELSIKKEPVTTVGKYVFKLFQNINKDKIYKFDYFKKPLINNICCYDKINKDLNYYNFYDGKFKDKESIIKNIKDNEKNEDINISETFVNLIKNTGFKYNFDSDFIFRIEEPLKFGNLEIFGSDKYDSSQYFEYSQIFKKLFEKNEFVKKDKNILNILENFGDSAKWAKLSSNIEILFKNLIDFTKKYAMTLDKEVINDLESYLVTLRYNKLSIDIDNLLNIKNITQKWVTYKFSYLLSKIINFKPIDINTPNFKNIISENDNIKIQTIIDNSNKELSGFNDSIKQNDTIKQNFNNKSNLFNIDSYKINLEDNSKKNNDVNNITKNIYLLNYLLLTIIYNMYTLILTPSNDDEDQEISIDSIFNRIDVFISSDEIDENKSSQLTLIANIISYILTEYRNDIKNNLINNENLQLTVNSLREDKKQRQIRYFENLSLEDVDAHKLLKEVGHRLDINEDYYEDKEIQEVILTNPENQEDIIFGEEIGDNDMLTDSDYQGENADEEDQDNI